MVYTEALILKILFDLINRACQEKCKHKIIVGDFNFPEIDWSNWMATTNENHNFFRVLECNCTVIESWNYFYSNVRQVIDTCIPETQYKKKVRPVWMDMYCKKLIEDKFRAWKKYTYSRKREDYEKFRIIRNRIPKCIRHARRKYEKGIARDVNSNRKAFWKYVHSKFHEKSGIGDLKDNCGNNVTDDRSKADILSYFFSPVFTKETGELPPFDVQVDKDICDVTINVQEVRELLKSVNTSKSTGPNEIHPRFLKELADHLAYPIVYYSITRYLRVHFHPFGNLPMSVVYLKVVIKISK